MSHPNRPFDLIAFQETLIASLERIASEGIGRHKRRSRFAARHRAVAELVRRGYADDQARQIVQDAVDTFELRQLANVPGDNADEL